MMAFPSGAPEILCSCLHYDVADDSDNDEDGYDIDYNIIMIMMQIKITLTVTSFASNCSPVLPQTLHHHLQASTK